MPPSTRHRALHFARAAALLLAVVASLEPARAQDASLSLEVEPSQIELGGDFELVVRADGRFDELRLPPLDDFDVLGQRISQVNRRVSRAYTLRPKRAGVFTLAGAELLLGGRVVAAAPPVKVTVGEPAAPTPVEAAQARDLEAQAKDGAFVRWSVERDRYVVGEPFVMTLELWLASGLATRQVELVKAAKFQSLLTEDLPRDSEQPPSRRVVGQTTFEVHRLMQTVATPLKPGRILIDATTVRVTVSEDGWSFNARTVNRSSQPFWLDVDAVPEAGRPDGFVAGHLGSFELKVSLADDRGVEPAEVRSRQRLVLRAEVSGRGALGALEPPEVLHDGTWDVALLPKGSEDAVTRSERGVEGRRVFQWLVTPREPGQHPAPRARLAWFDPLAGRYVTETSPERVLQVTGDAAPAQALAASALGEDVGPLVTPAALARPGLPPLAETPLYWGALGLALLGFLGVEWGHARARRDAATPHLKAARRALPAAREALRDLSRRPPPDPRASFKAFARVLSDYLEARAGIPAAGLTQEALAQALAREGSAPDLAREVAQEMARLELGAFAPDAVEGGLAAAGARVEALLGRLEAHGPRRSA